MKLRKNYRAVGYLVDFTPGLHFYVAIEGVGECRETFARLVRDVACDDIGRIIACKVEYLFVDTSPV